MNFWKVPPLLETYRGFGNPGRFWKPMGVLETYFGYPWRVGAPLEGGGTLGGL